jgi:hypothetical protein
MRARRQQRMTKIVTAMNAIPPSAPPTAGAATELRSDTIRSEMVEQRLRPSEWMEQEYEWESQNWMKSQNGMKS